MDWAPQQDEALIKIKAWMSDPNSPQLFKLFGYAGSGKTTMAKHIAETADGRVLFAAYTGKAASVLRSKGCIGASTIHRLIYLPKSKSRALLVHLENEEASLRREHGDACEERADWKEIHEMVLDERDNVARPSFSLNHQTEVKHAALVIIDECSMVDAMIGEDLLSFGTKVLVLGDPAQLPPVKSAGFFIQGEPDYMLTEIHRQARDNPIIQLATTVREGLELKLGFYGESKVILQKEMTTEIAMAADQILVGKNATRHSINKRMRDLKGYNQLSGLPIKGDKLVCCRNNHDLGLLNGTLWDVQALVEDSDDEVMLTITAQDDPELELDVNAWTEKLLTGELLMDWFAKRDAQEFEYGYALTVHKSQGSQWENVLVFDESHVFRRDARKHLYTAITRASEKVTVVDMIS